MEKENRIIISTAAFGDKEFTLFYNKRRKLYDERNQTIKEILENLELGKTKAEFDKVLKTLQDKKGGYGLTVTFPLKFGLGRHTS